MNFTVKPLHIATLGKEESGHKGVVTMGRQGCTMTLFFLGLQKNV